MKKYNEIEVEFESWEIIHKNELRKCEDERELVDEKLKISEESIRRIDDQKLVWLKDTMKNMKIVYILSEH